MNVKWFLIACFVALFAACDDPVATFRNECEGPYPDQATSPYVLPYEPGQTFSVGLANCAGTHAKGTSQQYAYDFTMPVGTRIVATRSGVVLRVEEEFDDANQVPGQHNFVHIVHNDGSIAVYERLTKNGSLVAVNDVVVQGQVIAMSGNTGSSSDPHLHFHVQSCSNCGSSPVTFRNTRAHPNGLVQGESYTAQ